MSYKPSNVGGSITRRQFPNGHFFLDVSNPMILKQDLNYVEIRNIDLSGFIDGQGNSTIAGFSVVQAEPQKKRIITEGFATRVLNPATMAQGIVPYITNGNSSSVGYLKGSGWLLYYCPDNFLKGVTIPIGSQIVVTQKCRSDYQGKIREVTFSEDNTLTKVYYGVNSNTQFTGEVENVFELPFYPETSNATIDGLGTISNKTSWGGSGNGGTESCGNRKALLIKIKSGSDLYALLSSDVTSFDTKIEYFLARIENPSSGFSSTGDSDLASTNYKFIGHYQSMDATFVAAIKNGSIYKTDVSVYGGQYYGGILEVMRYVPNLNSNGWKSSTVYLPVISEFNIRMRTGARHSKDRIVGNGSLTNSSGIGICDLKGQWEDYLLSNSYLSKTDGKAIAPVPMEFIIDDTITNAVFWTNKQPLQGFEDNFRSFFPSIYQICNAMGKEITGLEFNGDKLFVFQGKAVGYLPYYERTLVNTSGGQGLNVSSGGVFPKYELITGQKGISRNSHKIITPSGIFFYCTYDKSLNVLGRDAEDFGVKLGIASLIQETFDSPDIMVFNKLFNRILIRKDKKILELSLNPMVVNGYMNFDLANEIRIFPFGNNHCIINSTSGGNSTIYTEDENGSVVFHSEYKLTLILGSDRPELMFKIFDNLIIHSLEEFTPKTLKYTAGSRIIEESIENNENALFNSSIIYVSTPLVPILNGSEVLNYDRVGNYPICILELKSDSKFAISKVFCDYRNMK